MLGAISGDIIGSPYEFRPICCHYNDFPLFSGKSRFTDDSVLMILVGLGIKDGYNDEEKTENAIVDYMHRYCMRFFKAGYGQRFFQWIMKKSRVPYNSYGNGAAMRVSSVAWAYDNLTDVEKYATVSARITHNHPEGIKGACATASAIFLARSGASKKEIKEYISKNYQYDLSRTIDEIRINYRHIESSALSVPEAIIAFLESENFEDTIRKAIYLRGDSDTQAAIAGSLAEAYYNGVPEYISQEVFLRLDPWLYKSYFEIHEWIKIK